MISYELARKLKDGGFEYDWCKDIEECYEAEYPTLSELIEACGLPFGLDCNVKGYWYARQAHHSESIHTDFHPTPEEAVANLWLELNKK